MKRIFLILSLLLPITLAAQTPAQLRTDPSLWWAEGPDDARALTALTARIAPEVDFTSPDKAALLATYRTELRKESVALQEGTQVLRYLKKDRLDALFQPRRRKAEELLASARKAWQEGAEGQAKTYFAWAGTYLESLPRAFQGSLQEVQAALSALEGIEAAALPLPHIAREVQTLQSLLRTPVRAAAKAADPAKTPGPAKTPARVKAPEPAKKPAPVQPPLPERKLLNGLPAALAPLYQLPARKAAVSLAKPLTAPLCPEPKPAPPRWMLLADGYGDLSLGGTLAWRHGKAGAYLSARSHFRSVKAVYSCLSDGSIPGGGTVWTQGNPPLRSANAFTAGALYAPWWPALAFYAGAGYGCDDLYWQDLSGDWVQVQDLSFRGLVVEGGLLADIKLGKRLGLVLKAGVTSTALKTATPTLGAGVRF